MSQYFDTQHTLAALPQKPISWYISLRRLHTWLELEDGTTAHPFVLLIIHLELGSIVSLEFLTDQPDVNQIMEIIYKVMNNPPEEVSKEAYRPERVVVDDQIFSMNLVSSLEDLGIHVQKKSPPPNVAKIIAEIEDMLGWHEPSPPGLLSVEGVTIDMIGDLFNAAADFYLASPWDFLKDIQPIKIHFEQYQQDIYVQLMGAARIEYGLVFYFDWDDLIHTFKTANDPLEQLPPGGWRSLTFESPDFIPIEDLKAIEKYGWRVAGERAYPLLVNYTQTTVERPTRQELVYFDAILRTIPHFLDNYLQPDGMGDYHSIDQQLSIQTHIGRLTLTFQYPAGNFPEMMFNQNREGSIQNHHHHYGSESLELSSPTIAGTNHHSDQDIANTPSIIKSSEFVESQKLITQAMNESDLEVRIDLAFQALEICQDCADAYTILAQDHAETLDEACELFWKGTQIAERILGKDVIESNTGSLWDIETSHPYFRARKGYAECLALQGNLSQAIKHCQELLILDPEDHFGTRYTQMSLLLHEWNHADAWKLLETYATDTSSEWLYSKTLLIFREQGDSVHAREALNSATISNSFVPAYLLGLIPLPEESPSDSQPGDENEAINYVRDHFTNWWRTKGGIEWIKSTIAPKASN